MIKEILKQVKTILCIDGNLPDSSYFPKEKIIIAADGAANKLSHIGVDPDFIIGDLDSVKPENFANSKIIMDEDQNMTDFEKSLKFISANDLAPFLVYGAGGGFLDRIFDNLSLIIENELTFYSEGTIGIVTSKDIDIDLDYNTKVSIFGFDALISTKGFKWEMDNELLNFPGRNSISNRVIAKNIQVNLKKGKILLLIYEEQIEDKGSAINSSFL